MEDAGLFTAGRNDNAQNRMADPHAICGVKHHAPGGTKKKDTHIASTAKFDSANSAVRWVGLS